MRYYCIIFLLLATSLVKAQTTPPYCLQISDIWRDYIVCEAGIVETHINENSKSSYDFEISNFVPRSHINDSLYNSLVHYINHDVAQMGSVNYQNAIKYVSEHRKELIKKYAGKEDGILIHESMNDHKVLEIILSKICGFKVEITADTYSKAQTIYIIKMVKVNAPNLC